MSSSTVTLWLYGIPLSMLGSPGRTRVMIPPPGSSFRFEPASLYLYHVTVLTILPRLTGVNKCTIYKVV